MFAIGLLYAKVAGEVCTFFEIFKYRPLLYMLLRVEKYKMP